MGAFWGIMFMTFPWIKKVWGWCKIHWQFLLGLLIPIIVGIILRKNNSAEVYKKASEQRKKQLEVLKKSHEMESSLKEQAQNEFIEKSKEASDKFDDDIKRIDQNEKDRLKEINSAEKATAEIRKKLEE